jgi:hypothetical protein
MSVIDDIKIAIPEKTIDVEYLLKILAACNYSNRKLKPSITFVTKPVVDPSFSFTGFDLKPECFYVGKLPLMFNMEAPKVNSGKRIKPSIIIKKDTVGEYLKVKYPFATYDQLNLKQLFERVGDKIISLDHVGVNINPRLLPKSRYEKMKQIVARSSYLCDFPEKEWPFIIPTFSGKPHQGPKLELVYDFVYPYPEIQLDIQTNLSRKETLALFPLPYGYHDLTPITGDYCVNIFIYAGWANVSLRIDLRWASNNFNLTNWLLDHGSRVKPN